MIPTVAILGTGAAGLCMAMMLKRAGFESFVLLEKSNRLGGTWRDNTYPGAACDVPSHLYCYSFEPNADWSRKFAQQEEILAYLERCADKYQLHSHIRYQSEVVSAHFDETDLTWRIELSNGECHQADVFISGCGQLNRPFVPDFDGIADFDGAAFHSARWDHAIDLRDKRVAVIGNGASAIQFIPEIAAQVDRLTIFQRSAHWVIPKPDRRYLSIERALFRYVPLLRRLHRYLIYWSLEGRFAGFFEDSWLNRAMGWLANRSLRTVVDADLRERLTPSYTIGCKRILISNDYYDTLQRPNVQLVSDPIERIDADALLTRSGERHEADVIIYATGFESTNFLGGIEVHGRGGRTLRQAWHEGAEAYLGMLVAGFPNFFMLYGPNTNLGHNSIIFMIECQARYILQCIAALRDDQLGPIDVRSEVMAAYNAEIQAMLGDSVWSGSCSNWYKRDDGKVTTNWASYTSAYWRRTRRLDPSVFTH